MAVKKIKILEVEPKKYPHVDLTKECPFGYGTQRSCSTCRLALVRYSDQEVVKKRDSGDYTVGNRLYACSIVATLYETSNLAKAIRVLAKTLKEKLL